MIRVHTISLQATSVLSNIFKHADLDATLNLMVRQGELQIEPHISSTALNPLFSLASKDIAAKKVADIRKKMVEQVISILLAYRKRCAKTQSDGQLILPESLKLLPVYILGAIKSRLFSNPKGKDVLVHYFDQFSSFFQPLTLANPSR